MPGIVLDASAAIAAVSGEVDWVHGDLFHAHAGLDIEVMSVLRRQSLHGGLPAHVARDRLDRFAQLQIVRHPIQRILSRIWMLRHDISAYDAGYVALAEALGIPLLTFDRTLAKTAERYCEVVVL